MGNGIWALLKAPSMLYCTPRIILCPGYTGQLANFARYLPHHCRGQGLHPRRRVHRDVPAGQRRDQRRAAGAASRACSGGLQRRNPRPRIVHRRVRRLDDGGPDSDVPSTGWRSNHSAARHGLDHVLALLPASVRPSRSMVRASTFVNGAPTGNQVQIASNDLQTTLDRLMTFLTGSANVEIAKNTYSLTAGTLLIVNKSDRQCWQRLHYEHHGDRCFALRLAPHRRVDAEAPTPVQVVATIALGANPICSMLPGVLDGLIGHAIVESAGTGQIADQNWRTTLNHPRLIGVSGGVKILDPISGNVVVRPFAPRVAGLMVAVDFRQAIRFIAVPTAQCRASWARRDPSRSRSRTARPRASSCWPATRHRRARPDRRGERDLLRRIRVHRHGQFGRRYSVANVQRVPRTRLHSLVTHARAEDLSRSAEHHSPDHQKCA